MYYNRKKKQSWFWLKHGWHKLDIRIIAFNYTINSNPILKYYIITVQ